MKPGVAQSCHCRWCWQICPSSRGVQRPEQGRRMPCSSSQGSVWSVLLAAWIASACRSEASSSSTSSSSIPRPHTHPSSTTAAKLLPEALWVISCRREAGMGQGSVGKTSPEGAGKEDFTQVPRELGKALRSFSMMSSRHMLTSWVLASTSSAVGRRAGGYMKGSLDIHLAASISAGWQGAGSSLQHGNKGAGPGAQPKPKPHLQFQCQGYCAPSPLPGCLLTDVEMKPRKRLLNHCLLTQLEAGVTRVVRRLS